MHEMQLVQSFAALEQVMFQLVQLLDESAVFPRHQPSFIL